jgi:hypothetical protein
MIGGATIGLLLSGCAKSTQTEWPTYKPPFDAAVPKTGVFQYDPSSGKAVADKALGLLVCKTSIPANSGQRQVATAELMLDDAIYFTAPQTVSLSAMLSLEWKLVGFRPRDVGWVEAELRLENINRPEEKYSMALVRQMLNLKGQAAGKKHLFNVQTTVPVEAGKRYRVVFAAQTVSMANGGNVQLPNDEWKKYTPQVADVLPANQVMPLDAEAQMYGENRAEVQCTLHFFKMR